MNTEIAEKIKNILEENVRISSDALDYTIERFSPDFGLNSIDSIQIVAAIDNLFCA